MRTNLKAARKAQRLTQQELADVIGIERSVYCRIETGKYDIKLSIAQKIALVLNESVEKLFSEEIANAPEKQ